MKISFVFIFFLVTVRTPFATSEETVKVEYYDWPATVERFLNFNPEISAARMQLESARFNLRGSYSGFFPSFAAGLTYRRTSSPVQGSNNLSSLSDARENYGVNLSANQNLFSGLRDLHTVNLADHQFGAAANSFVRTLAELSYQLRITAGRSKFAVSSLSLARDIERRREENLRLVQLRYENGSENKGSSLLAAAYLDSARYETLQASQDLQSTEIELARLLGITAGNFLPQSEAPESLTIPEQPDLEALAVRTPEYIAAVWEEKAAKSNIEISRSQFYPSLNINGSLFRQDTAFFPQGNQWSMGMSVSYPIFDGGKDYYGIKAANANAASKQYLREASFLNMKSKVQTSWQNFFAAEEKLKVDISFLRAAEARAEIARNKYNLGLLSFDQWDIIENDLIQRQKRVLETKLERNTAQANWLLLQGIPVEVQKENNVQK
ncbi:MAG: TolC family protein [Leptospiraceae bacterium]|nr:TolC family protein [Leptospiraceae bacterium]